MMELVEIYTKACDSASGLYKVKMFPFFAFIHFIIVANTLRKRNGAYSFAKNHPISSCLVSVISSFSGGIIIYFLIAQPIAQIFLNWQAVALSAFAWYLVFFSPLDICHSLLQQKPVKAILIVLKEIHRTRMIFDGIHVGFNYHQQSFLLIVLFGCIKGSGAKFLLRPFDCLARGLPLQDHEFLVPHFSTKSSVLISILAYSVHEGLIPNLNEGNLFLAVFIYMSVMQLLIAFDGLRDPYAPLQKLIWKVFVELPNTILKDAKKKVE